MWPRLRRLKTTGSRSAQIERLIVAIEENTAVMRAHLAAVGQPQPKASRGEQRKLTAKDVIVVTRETIAEEQEKARERERIAASPV